MPADSLLVLGSHRAAPARAALVRCVAALQRRAAGDLVRRLRAGHYFLHLANQVGGRRFSPLTVKSLATPFHFQLRFASKALRLCMYGL